MLPELEIILRLVMAAVLGSLIGLERERLNWTAGLRTHMLVCVGAALFMLVSAYGFFDILESDTPNVELDVSRVAAQVVSGIGFLGAGTIIFRNKIVRGLTTAASLWTVAAVGLAVGGGLYLAAISATALILLILAGLRPLERYFFRHRRPRQLLITSQIGGVSLGTIEQVLTNAQLAFQQISVERDAEKSVEEWTIRLEAGKSSAGKVALEQLRTLPGIRAIRLR
jgi:putative Mg2+ transporter-C (MgtC) family protein